MGNIAGQDLGNGVKWTPNGKWCTSLGVPIGNNLDEKKMVGSENK